MKNKIISIIAGFILLPVFAAAQHSGGFEKYWFIRAIDTLPYQLLLPAHYDSHKTYPLVLFLHGSGERGNDNMAQLSHGGDLFINDSIRKNYPAIVVFPQCSATSMWANMKMTYDSVSKQRTFDFSGNLPPTSEMKLLMALIQELKINYPVDKARLYIGGLSLGGMGTFDIVKRMPGTFAAAFPICGASDTAAAKNLKGPTWWIFHGQKDSTVFAKYSKEMAEALTKSGAKVTLTIYPEDGHNSWDDAFKEPGLFEWMFSNKLKN
ncbi:MAG: dienelactone hydrolase family protein [Ginsengibacter sp.]